VAGVAQVAGSLSGSLTTGSLAGIADVAVSLRGAVGVDAEIAGEVYV